MSRYIDVELLKNKILEDMAKAEREGRDCNGYTDALFHLKTIPSADVVEVVRCKDCKYAEHWYDNEFDCRCPVAPWASDEYAMLTNENDFCSYGKRRYEQCEKD